MITTERTTVDDEFIRQRIRQAVQLRRDTLKLDSTTDAYRLVHAEGDGLTGLIADRFGRYVVIELFSLAMDRRIEMIEDAFIDAGLEVDGFLLRTDKAIALQEGIKPRKRSETKTDSTIITENGVKFAVDLKRGHKTGFFCDQRDNRLALTAHTRGKRVLDVCCYTGGFSMYASTLGHAAEVTAVDLDENALVTARTNAKLNNASVQTIHADAFDFLRDAQKQGRQWDVVIVDPSKFVSKRAMLETGLRKYSDLNRLAAGVVAPGGLMVTCSCSGPVDQETFITTVSRATRYAGRTMQIINLTGAGADHPFLGDTPESRYLKLIWARVW
jgi:23S rRNA (cytosine1962-C5)-methyltransferase